MQRVMLTMPPDLLADVDAWARRTGKKRSQLVRQALQDLLARERQREFEALLAEGYQTMARQLEETAEQYLPLAAEAAAPTWQWDD